MIKNFTRERVRKYGLRSQKFVTEQKAEELLKSKGFVLTNQNKNCLFTNGGKESMKHWIVKAMIFKILREMGRTVGSEVEVSSGIVDIIDVNNMIVYEVEMKMCWQEYETNMFGRVRDVFIINLGKVPDDLNDAERYLREKIV
jgi:UTP-glucose-1-phosphate uridylyltransferase